MDSYPAPSRLREQTSPPCSRDAHVCPHSRGWWSCFPLVFGLRLSDLTLPPDGCSGRVWVGCRPRPEPFTSSPDPQASAIGDVGEQWRLSPAWGLCFDAKRKGSHAYSPGQTGGSAEQGILKGECPTQQGLCVGFTPFSHQNDSFTLSFPHALPLGIRESPGSRLSVQMCFLSTTLGRR